MENHEKNQQSAVTQTSENRHTEVVSFWSYFGMILLFAIPVIGFIACIAFMFAPKNKSKKNYARAAMTWMVLQLVIALVAGAVALSVLGSFALPAINDALGTNFQSIQEVISLGIDTANGNYTSAIIHFRPQLIEALGEEYAPLLDELVSGDYRELFQQIKNEQYDQILRDLRSGKYPKLVATMKAEDYDLLLQELEAVANGDPSEIIDQIRNVVPPIF